MSRKIEFEKNHSTDLEELSLKCDDIDSIIPEVSDRVLLENLFDGVYYVDMERRIRFWNKGAERITGYTAQHMVGLRCDETSLDHRNSCGAILCNDGCPFTETINSGEPHSSRTSLTRSDGSRIPVDIQTSPIIKHGKILGAMEVFRDASVYEELEKINGKLKELANKDVLTGISSRRWTLKRMLYEIQRAERYDEKITVAMIDVDRFKWINDNHGHIAGDKILKCIANYFADNLRGTDIFGRYGGDEFIAVLLKTGIEEGAQRMGSLLENYRTIAGSNGNLRVTLSIGLAERASEETTEQIIARADKALYRAKKNGRDQLAY